MTSSLNSLKTLLRRLLASSNVRKLCRQRSTQIDRMHKWRPTKYSFVFVLIRPTSLVLKEHFFCILSVLTRLVSLISTQTKEYFVGRHLCIRSIRTWLLKQWAKPRKWLSISDGIALRFQENLQRKHRRKYWEGPAFQRHRERYFSCSSIAFVQERRVAKTNCEIHTHECS